MSADNKLRWGILGAARVNERLLPAIIEAPNSYWWLLPAVVPAQQRPL